MIPDRPWSATTSPAEYTIFDLIHDQLDDDWCALHSVGLAWHRSKPWAEIDFVLVGPPGVICLEVKGGTIGREGGKWFSRSYDGNLHDLGKGPFDQVATAQAALRSALLKRVTGFSDRLIGYGVLTPDNRFLIRGPDIEPDLVYDADDVSHPFSAYTDRLARYWSQRYGHKKPLTRADRTRVVNAIRGDFHLVPSLKATVAGIERELLRLTEEQADRLVDIEDNDAVIVAGGAGTGKTMLAVEEARRQSAKGARTLLCCFSKTLAAHLRLVLDDTHDVDVHHFHGLTSQLIREADLTNQLSRPGEPDHFPVDHPLLASEALLVLNRFDHYDTLIIDEAQDLLTVPNLDFLNDCLKGGIDHGRWRIFVDINQNLFGGVADQAMTRLHTRTPTQLKLRKNCRNTRPIAVMNSLLTGIGLAETRTVEGPIPQRITYDGDREQARLIAKHLKHLTGRGIQAEDIVVLSPRRRANSVFAQPLPGGPPIIDYIEGDHITTVRHSTIRGFKGLESQVILVADIDDLSSSHARADLYVACSRAKAILTLFCENSTDDDYALRARDFGAELVHQFGPTDEGGT